MSMVSDFDNNKADGVMASAISKQGSTFDVESVALDSKKVKRKASVIQLANY